MILKGEYINSKLLETLEMHQYLRKDSAIYGVVVFLSLAVLFFAYLGVAKETWLPRSLNSSTTIASKSEEKTPQQPTGVAGSGDDSQDSNKNKTWWRRHWKKIVGGFVVVCIIANIWIGGPKNL